MAKKKPPSPFTGRWRIVSMSAWEAEYIDEEEEGYFEFDEKGYGSFHFGYVQGDMDCELTTRDGEPAAVFAVELEIPFVVAKPHSPPMIHRKVPSSANDL